MPEASTKDRPPTHRFTGSIPRMRRTDGAAVATCIHQALLGDPILVRDDGLVTFEDWRVVDPERRRPDTQLASDLLDWRPKVPLREGLTRTIEWMREAMLAEDRGGSTGCRRSYSGG